MLWDKQPYVLGGPDWTHPEWQREVVAAKVHGGYDVNAEFNDFERSHDIATIFLDEDAPVRSLPWGKLKTSDIGTDLTLVGYGWDDGSEQTGDGTKRRTTMKLTEIYDDWLTLEREDGTVCHGDSGGPTFIKRDGVWMIVGVIAWMDDEECSGNAYSTNVAGHSDFMEWATTPPGPHTEVF